MGERRAPSPPPGTPGYQGPPQSKPAPPPAPPPKRACGVSIAIVTTAKRPVAPPLWGGFVNGVLHVPLDEDEARATPEVAIFTSEADARRFYDDVRPIEVHEVQR